jgi:pilus assembly protein CpaC
VAVAAAVCAFATPPALCDDADLRQVLIEVVIFEVESDKASATGMDWLYRRAGATTGNAINEIALRTLRLEGDNLVTFPTPATGPSATIRPSVTGQGVAHPLAGMTVEGDFIIGDHGTVYGRLRALVDKGDARIVSRPIVVVRSGKTAEIHVGGEVPYQNLSYNNNGQSVLSVAFEKVGVDMIVTPTILEGNIVKIDLNPVKVAALTHTENIRGVDLPFFGSREESTTVRVPNGETYRIGGLRSKETRETVRRIPVLGKIPLLGALFRSTELSTVETDLTILVTPTILNPGQEVPLPREFRRAEDARRTLEEEL